MTALLSLALFTLSAQTQSGPTEIPRSRIAAVDSFLTNISGFGYSGSVLLARGGKVLLRKGYGYANRESRTPNSPNTIFDIGSMVKAFTSVAIFQLLESGSLDLSDPFSKYVPGVPEDKKAITIAQLLTHTAGLDRDFPLKNPAGPYYEEVGKDEALKRILEVPLIAKPGEKSSYSNLGFILLAAVVENVSGQPYREYIREHILLPAKMTRTGFWGAGIPAVPVRDIAHSYEDNVDTGQPDKLSSTTWYDLGGGEMVSSVDDLAKFMRAILDGRLLKQKTRGLMWSNKDEHGYGWFNKKRANRDVIEHPGDFLGFGAELGYFPSEDLILVDLANSGSNYLGTHHVVDAIVPQLLFDVKPLTFLKDQRFTAPPASKPVPASTTQEIIGEYTAQGGSLRIFKDKNILWLSGQGQPVIDVLYSVDADEKKHLDAMSSWTKAIYNEVYKGEKTTLSQHSRTPELIDDYYNHIRMNLSGEEKELGKFLGAEVYGTVPFSLGLRSFTTLVEWRFAGKSEYLKMGWLNDKIIFVRGRSKDEGYFLPLRQAPDGSFLGWSIDTYRGVALKRVGKDQLEITSELGQTITAKRVSAVAG